MAIRFDAGTDVIVVPGWTGNVWSLLLWVRRQADRNAFSNPWVVRNNSNGTGTQLAGLGSDSGGDNLVTFDSAFVNQTGPSMASGAWLCIALVANNTSWTLYYGTTSSSLTTVGPDTRNAVTTPGSFTLSDATDWLSGDIANMKLFTRALNATDVANELHSYSVVNSTNLVRAHSFQTVSMVPDSGSGGNLTAGSTATTQVSGPAELDLQNITPSAVTSGEAFGTAALKLDQFITCTGIASAEAVGSAVVSRADNLRPVAITSGELFGTPRVVLFPRIKQSGWNFTPGGQTTISATLDEQTAIAGNLIVFSLAAHKDIGTFTLAGSGWHYPVNLRSSFVSLVIAWKVAAGGEDTISGTVTSGNETGSNALVMEIESPAAGQWAEMAIASNNTTGTNIANVSTGTTPAATGDGLAVATFGVDNILSDSVDSFSNGYINEFSQGWGQYEAGLWVATHTLPFGLTTESTLTRGAPVTASKMSGGVVSIGRAAPVTISPASIGPAETFGSTVVFGPLAPGGIASAEAFGSHTVARGVLVISPPSIPSTEAFGPPVLHNGPILQLTGIPTAEAFGTPLVERGVRKTWIGGVNPTAVYVGGVRTTVYVGGVIVWQ